MKALQLFLVFFITTQSITVFAQYELVKATAKPEVDADKYFETGVYDEALRKYEDIISANPNAKEVYQKIAKCYLYQGTPSRALPFLKVLIKAGSGDKDILLDYSRALHGVGEYQSAIAYYKAYMATIPVAKQYKRQLIKDDILRCVQGLRASKKKKEPVIVENLGRNVNTSKDEFGPVVSPNNSDRIYFSAIDDSNYGEKYNLEGEISPEAGVKQADIFYSTFQNGDWILSERMGSQINTVGHDEIETFSSNGQELISYRGHTSLDQGAIYLDRFYGQFETPEPVLFHENIEQSFSIEKSPTFYLDSIILFSSNRLEGFGGYDLYYSTFDYNALEWNTPVNLGPSINTPYDETDPVLMTDGRTIYFSSNSTKSIGGFDIFKASFNDERAIWGEPQSLGLPINSPLDETSFVVSKEGDIAYFDSNREGGEGAKDIYKMYFKVPLSSQLKTLNPLTFIQVQPNTDLSHESNDTQEERVELTLRSIFYDEGEDVIDNNIRRQLESVTKVLLDYPTARLNLSVYTDDSAPLPFSLFSGYLTGKEIVDHLVSKGVSPSNVIIQSYGSPYPMAKGNDPNVLGMNRSIDMQLENVDNLPIDVDYFTQQVSQKLSVDNRKNLKAQEKGLSYRIQFKESPRLFKDPILTKEKDVLLEHIPGQNSVYLTGIYRSYFQAENARKSFIARYPSYQNAILVPYLDGIRIQDEYLEKIATKHVDLYRYINN